MTRRTVRYMSGDFGIFIVVCVSALAMSRGCSNPKQPPTKPGNHREVPGSKPNLPAQPTQPPPYSPPTDQTHLFVLV